ncbi:unnamed protein product, partial [Allacma fusca]
MKKHFGEKHDKSLRVASSQALVETENYGPQENDLGFLLKDVNHIWLSGDP